MNATITTIPKGRPDHISLDFDLLRAEGIKHLENLATEVWTDFNAHDPGITMLEVLCYAITDLGYRTRMLPVEDLMMRPNPKDKIWFEATAVLPNAPVTQRDFRKLLIDVKGVKNAWLRKANKDEIILPMYRLGWIFPPLLDKDQKWDKIKIEALFAKAIPNYDVKDYDKYEKCLKEYQRSLEQNPNLVVFQQLVQQVKIEIKDRDNRVKTKLLQGLDALMHLDLKSFLSEQGGFLNADLDITAQNAAYYLSLYKNPDDEFPPFPKEWDDLITKYQAYNQQAYEDDNFKVLFRSFQFQALKNTITDSKGIDYTIVKDDDAILSGLLAVFATEEFENVKIRLQLVRNFFFEIGNRDLYKKDGQLIARINEDLKNQQEPELSSEQEALIVTYIESLERVITERDVDTIIKYLDEKGDKTPIREALHKLYWVELPNILGTLLPIWEDIEKEEYNNVFKSVGSKKSKSTKRSAVDGDIDYDDFKQIVTLELPERSDIKRHKIALLNKYAPTVTLQGQNTPTVQHRLRYIALSSFLKQAFQLEEGSAIILQILTELDKERPVECKILVAYLHEHFCDYGINGLTLDRLAAHEFYPDPISLNGIYRIILDLDDTVNTANPKQVEEVVNRAMKRLHDNRALCEDFLLPQIVEQQPVHFCIHLEVATDRDERAVMAEVIWRFQEHLTPTLRFKTFKEMRDAGLQCDEIYNGPLLKNGFLLDKEVDEAQLLSSYNHSDLVRIAMQTPGVLGVRELKVKEHAEIPGKTFEEKAVYNVKVSGNNLDAPFVKRVIDLCDSCFYVSKGALPSMPLTEEALHERLEWLKLTQNCELCGDPGGHQPTGGVYRDDLSDYLSVQYDLPSVYTVGDHKPMPNDLPVRKAQARQLQAYLAFYDQILAAYLAQLGQVNQLLSIDQNPLAPTRVLPALYEVPGVRELIENQAIFVTKPEEWTKAIIEYVPEAERTAVRTELSLLASQAHEYQGFITFRQELYSALSTKNYEAYAANFADFFWAKYAADEANNYRQALAQAAETPAHRRQHRNRLMSHLLARFGESFTDYVHALLLPDAEPEDNPWQQNFDDYLEDKARFLRDVAHLAHDRGSGYNYRKLLTTNHQPDVWNTGNVAGIKKRVSRLTGIDDYSQKSLIAEPPYRLDIVATQTKQGTAQYRIVLKRRPEALDASDNPLHVGPLLYSPKYNNQKKTQEKVTELYKNIWKSSLYKAEPLASDPDKWVVRYTLTDNELLSDPMGEEEAKGLLILLQDLVKPGKGEKEGFHLIEHILLRPNDAKDNLLQIPLGCDPRETPYDPYSFWVTVILPNWTKRFKHADFQYFFEQSFRTELPAHIAVRFCWIDLDNMYLFEDLYRKWMIEKAKCTPNECHVNEVANALIDLLNTMPCTCNCDHEAPVNMCQNC